MNRLLSGLTLLGALLLSSPSYSQSPAVERMQALQDAFHDAHPSARLDRGQGADPLAIASRLKVYAEGDSPLAQSRSFLKRWSEVFGLDSITLVHAETVTMKGRAFVRFDLSYKGLPVVGRQVVLTFDDAGALLRVTSDVLPTTPLAARLVDAEEAVERAELHTGLTARDSKLVNEAVQLDRQGATRVWLVQLPGRTAVIDAHDGSLRNTRTAVHR